MYLSCTNIGGYVADFSSYYCPRTQLFRTEHFQFQFNSIFFFAQNNVHIIHNINLELLSQGLSQVTYMLVAWESPCFKCIEQSIISYYVL